MKIVEERLTQAEGQLAYWQEQAATATRQVAMWQGAVEALRGVREALEQRKGDDVAQFTVEEQAG